MRVCVDGGCRAPQNAVQSNSTAPPVPRGFKGPSSPSQIWLRRPGWEAPVWSAWGGHAAAGRASLRWCPPPRSYLSLPAPHLGAGRLSAPLGSSPRQLGRSLGAGGLGGRGAPGRPLRRRRRGPGLRRGLGWGAEAARADKGRGRSCGETVRDAASAEPAPAPSGPSSPSHGRRSGPLPATRGSASWALIPESSERWCSGLLVPFQTSVIAAGTWG